MILCPWKDLPRYLGVNPGLEEAINTINALENHEAARYPLSNNGAVMVKTATSKKAGDLLEAHRKFLDIHYTLEGTETMGWADLSTLTPAGEFNEQNDGGMFRGECQFIQIPAGYCCVVFPEDAHMPQVHLDDTPVELRKIVVKLKV